MTTVILSAGSRDKITTRRRLLIPFQAFRGQKLNSHAVDLLSLHISALAIDGERLIKPTGYRDN